MTSERPPTWWQPAAFDYGAAEMLCMRLLFAITAFLNVKWETRTMEQRVPHGLAHLMDLSWLAAHPPSLLVQSLVGIALVPYVVGRLSALSLLPLWIFSMMIGSLVTSEGINVNHTWQLISLILSAQFLVYAWAWVKERHSVMAPSHRIHQRAIFASVVVFAASYVACGMTKLIASHGRWIADLPLLAVGLMKSNWADHYNTLAPLPEWLNTGTRWMLENPNLARLFFGWGLVIELAGFAVLISRRWSLIVGLAIIAFHLGVSYLMRLDFEYHIAAALIFCVNLPGLPRALRGAR
jgi:hypothetical protein